jgi:hypothetical protein
MGLEIKEIEIDSPINLKIGNNFNYKGHYKNGYEEGFSKIKRFYKEVPFWDGIERKIDKYDSGFPIWMVLENGKLVLIGYIEYNGIRILENFL